MTKSQFKTAIDLMPDEVFEVFAVVSSAYLDYLEEKKGNNLEQIENLKLLKLVNKRIEAYGGWEKAQKHFLSQEEFMSKLGITKEDVENAEDDVLL
jgi:hypothetical protein